MSEGAQIGYIIKYPDFVGVCCEECHDAADKDPSGPAPPRLYHENVYPYKQTCHGCGKVLVQSKTDAWPELYSNPKRA